MRSVVVLPAPLGPRNPKIVARLDAQVDARDRLDDVVLLAEGPPQRLRDDDRLTHGGPLPV